jgi:hypothetical protein
MQHLFESMTGGAFARDHMWQSKKSNYRFRIKVLSLCLTVVLLPALLLSHSFSHENQSGLHQFSLRALSGYAEAATYTDNRQHVLLFKDVTLTGEDMDCCLTHDHDPKSHSHEADVTLRRARTRSEGMDEDLRLCQQTIESSALSHSIPCKIINQTQTSLTPLNKYLILVATDLPPPN